jgi:signal transduction histidine kinase
MSSQSRQSASPTTDLGSDRIPLTGRIPVSHREWAMFGLRWIIPIGLLLHLFGTAQGEPVNTLRLMLVVGVSALSNLIVLLVLMTNSWTRLASIVIIVLDTLLVLAGITATGASMIWLGLVPVSITGFYFNWMEGLLAGVLLAGGFFATQVLSTQTVQSDLEALVLGILVVPAAGPLVALLSRSDGEQAVLRDRFRERSRRVEQVARLAQEQMHVIYEMAEVLSKSKLDPKRVLASAVTFALDSLERMGVPPPLFAMVLLFADAEVGSGTVLRVARASMTVAPSDQEVEVRGRHGIIEKVLRLSDPAVSHAPDNDPELAMFDSFRQCKSVLVLPLRAGDEAYGVMCIGCRIPDSFKDTHIELMAAVTNQAAAALNNVRLYVTLLEERDRIVQIEKDARAQLASELHDGPTQGVAAITMRLNYVRKLIERKPESAVDELYAIEDMARRTTKEIRHMLFELRPKALDSGLRSGLEQLAVKMKETYDQNVVITMSSGLDEKLDTQTTQTLFSIASEVVNNARKHAQATRIEVALHTESQMLVLNVTDNGVGFDVEKALEEAKHREGHLGLLNLQERAALLEGALHIDSSPGHGTRTTVVIPIEVVEMRREEESNRAANTTDRVVARISN